MKPYELNRILDFRFEAYSDKYWCFSYDQEKGFVFMFVFDNLTSGKKVQRRMRIVADYILKQFKHVNAAIFPRTTYTRKQDSTTSNNLSPMCVTEEKTGTWLPIVKKTVDSVYEYLIQHPDGIGMSALEYGKRGARVCSKLVARNIISKKGLGRGNGWKYRWEATMAPTKVLYGSIAHELYDEDKKYKGDHNARLKSASAVSCISKPDVVREIMEVEATPVLKPGVDLSVISDQDLWNALKGRGYHIENNRLVKVEYLD